MITWLAWMQSCYKYACLLKSNGTMPFKRHPETVQSDRMMKHWHTCTTETKEIEDPVSDGGVVNLDLGFA